MIEYQLYNRQKMFVERVLYDLRARRPVIAQVGMRSGKTIMAAAIASHFERATIVTFYNQMKGTIRLAYHTQGVDHV